MVSLTKKENEILLLILKDFSRDYNANSISKQIEITPRGALKILKKLKTQNLLISKQLGKATFYKINLEDEYASKFIETLLLGQAREKASRWLTEFKELSKYVEIAVIFGSALKTTKTQDIDILLIFPQKSLKKVRQLISEKNKILLKPIHPIIQSPKDLQKNLEKKDPVLLNALKKGYILYGQEKLVGVFKHVTRF